jgi:hypothetical protein
MELFKGGTIRLGWRFFILKRGYVALFEKSDSEAKLID